MCEARFSSRRRAVAVTKHLAQPNQKIFAFVKKKYFDNTA
jgi:hypothetical protein